METTLNAASRSFIPAEQHGMCRLVFLFILCSLLYSYFSGTLLHQLCHPVLQFPYVDPAYWAMLVPGIPQWFSQHYGIALSLDLAMLLICISIILFPGRRFFVISFFILYCIYFICFNTYSTLHTHSKVGILLMPVPFMVKNKKNFTFLWEGMRYFALFVYADAFLWKLFRGDFLYLQQGSLIIKTNLAPYLYFHPKSIQTSVYTWFLQHEHLTGWLCCIGGIMEGIFLVGFFTKKWDKYLFVLSILLPIGFIFFADAFFFELCILSLTLIDFRKNTVSQ